MLTFVSTRHSGDISRICQEGRTQFLENLIDNKLGELQGLTDRLHRWPIPRPLIMKQRKRALACLAWLGNELRESAECDRRLLQAAEQIVGSAAPFMPAAAPAIIVAEQPTLDHNTAAKTDLAIVEDC